MFATLAGIEWKFFCLEILLSETVWIKESVIVRFMCGLREVRAEDVSVSHEYVYQLSQH